MSFYNVGQCNVVEKPEAKRDGEATQRLATTWCSCPPLPPQHTQPLIRLEGQALSSSFLPPSSLLLMFPTGPTQLEVSWHRSLGKVPPSLLLQKADCPESIWVYLKYELLLFPQCTIMEGKNHSPASCPVFPPTVPLPIIPVHSTLWKDWHWSWSSSVLAAWCEEPTLWKRPWC